MRRVWTINGCCLAFVFLWWGWDLVEGFRALKAPVAALARLPRMGFAGGVLVLGVLAFGGVVQGWRKKRGPQFKGNRVLPIVLVMALFTDLFVLPGEHLPATSPEQLELTLELFGKVVAHAGRDGRLPSDVPMLAQLAGRFGAPPYLVRGKPVARYRIEVRTGCEGPITSAPKRAVGTLLYCLSKDEKTAWLSAVALPAEVTFGPAEIFAENGKVRALKIVAEKQSSG